MMTSLPIPLIVGTFIIGYLAIIFEFYIKINKTAIGLALAGLCWMLYFVFEMAPFPEMTETLAYYLGEVSEIIFFLLGAMTIVELIDSHKGFNGIISWIQTRSKRKLIILISIIAFFLSAVLDNLTTTILMLSILRKLIPNKADRLLPNIMIVVAANAGGAWTPIGDVTTTMLWINERISTLAVIKTIFLPSLVSMIVTLACYLYVLPGRYEKLEVDFSKEPREPGANLVFGLGVLSLIAVPVIKYFTGLPPYICILLGVAVLWIVTDILHHQHEDRHRLRIPFILTKIEISSVLFFLGILLGIHALEAIGVLKTVADTIGNYITSPTWIAAFIGVVSAVIDNVPLVAAAMGMYDLHTYPVDAPFWLLLAFTAGTGGSLLSVGSAAGVALMGIEKVDFITYLKKGTLPIALGYMAGVGVTLLL
jgi:Na+/H+ antiporter NhaD/arsenite permease-like protein